jgi:hypothetical protein
LNWEEYKVKFSSILYNSTICFLHMQGFKYFSSLPVLHYWQAVLFLKLKFEQFYWIPYTIYSLKSEVPSYWPNLYCLNFKVSCAVILGINFFSWNWYVKNSNFLVTCSIISIYIYIYMQLNIHVSLEIV